MSHNRLSPAEIERLAKLTEECGEVSQMVGKILVHGWNNFHPRKPEEGTNRKRLEEEVGGLMAVIRIMTDRGDLDWGNIRDATNTKINEIWKYLHEQEDYVASRQTVDGRKEGSDSEDRRGGCC